MSPWGQLVAAGAVVAPILAGAWAFGDHYGFRPATKAEVEDIRTGLDQLAGDVLFLRFMRWHQILGQGGSIGIRNCGLYAKLATRFGIRPYRCR